MSAQIPIPTPPPITAPPPKRRRMKLWQWLLIGLGGFVALVVLVVVVAAMASGGGSPAQSPSQNPSQSPSNPPATLPTQPPAQTTQQHYKVGDVVNASAGWQVTINSVKTSQGDEFIAPKAGNTYVIVDVTVKNTAASAQSVSSPLFFTLRDSAGQSYSETYVPNTNDSPNGNVESGGVLRGQMAFEAPQSQHDLTLRFNPDPLSSDQIIWDLHV